MPAIWFIGDTHFGHAKVAEIRGFPDVKAHDDAVASRWLKQVKFDDTVYVLGDISSGSTTGELHALDILMFLPGRKRLIAGNHDSVSSIHRGVSRHARQYGDVFESVNDYGRVRIEGRDVLMSHYPYITQGDGPDRGEARYAQWRLPDLGNLLIHAHTHHTDPFSGSPTGREMCVSWDAWRRLVNLGDVARWIKET